MTTIRTMSNTIKYVYSKYPIVSPPIKRIEGNQPPNRKAKDSPFAETIIQ